MEMLLQTLRLRPGSPYGPAVSGIREGGNVVGGANERSFSCRDRDRRGAVRPLPRAERDRGRGARGAGGHPRCRPVATYAASRPILHPPPDGVADVRDMKAVAK